MAETIKCIAVHGVTTDRLYLPGEPLELSEADFDTLEAAGAVERSEPEPGSSSSRTPDGSVDNAGAGKAPATPLPRPVTDVKGIGPKTAKQLAALGIETLGDLASITPEEGLARVASGLDVVGDELAAVTRWRGEARVLIEAESSGE